MTTSNPNMPEGLDTNPRGSTVKTKDTERETMLYGIFDHELDMLGEHSVMAKAFWGTASACGSITIAAVFQLITGNISGEAKSILGTIAVISFLATSVFAVLGLWANKKYGTLADKIRKESKPRT